MIDLHIHSTASDGSKTPTELVNQAIDLDLSAIALTDHDTVSGLDEFLLDIQSSKIKRIPGVEIAMHWNKKEFHILGYWIDHKNKELLDLLQTIRDNRGNRNQKIIAKLNKNGMHLSIEDVLQKAKGESVGRPHIAAVLVEKGYFASVRDVFSTCLAGGGTGYIGRVLPSPAEAIKTIKNAGGITMWAHPFHRGKSNREFDEHLKYFIELGLDGVEAYYTEFTEYQHNRAVQSAKELNLAISGGTDYHGDNQPGVYLGTGRGNLRIPNKVYDNLLSYYQENHA
jgi:3',5'-nucleoside bisphosphate phosphatase